MLRKVLAIICFLNFFIGCQRRSDVSISVINVDKTTLDSVVVDVTGRSYRLGNILSNDTVEIKVNPLADSHVEIKMISPQNVKKRFFVGSYFEPGYSGSLKISINSDSVVSVIDSLRVSKY